MIVVIKYLIRERKNIYSEKNIIFLINCVRRIRYLYVEEWKYFFIYYFVKLLNLNGFNV